MLAIRTGLEEFQVGEEEMGHFLKAAQNVARHYNVDTTQKTLDWIAFVGVGGQVFGTRAIAISLKLRDRPKARQRGGDNVRTFPQPITVGEAFDGGEPFAG